MMPGWFGDAMFAYARFGMPPSTRVFIPFERHAYWTKKGTQLFD
jgi:hypothetical protein